MRREYQARRDLLYEGLNRLGFQFPLPEGAFYAFVPMGRELFEKVLSLFLYKRTHHVGHLFRIRWPSVLMLTVLSAVTYYFVLKAFSLADVTLVYPLLQLTTLFTVLGGIIFMKEREHFWQIWLADAEEIRANPAYILRILLIGYTSEEQLQYEERVLQDIISELGGEFRKTRPTDESWIKNADSAGMWMMTGGYMSNTAGVDSLRICEETGKRLGKKMLEEIQMIK
jgi:hypothetical protein